MSSRLTLLAFFAFMLIPIWIILASVAFGWIGERVMKRASGGSALVLLRAMERQPGRPDRAPASKGRHELA